MLVGYSTFMGPGIGSDMRDIPLSRVRHYSETSKIRSLFNSDTDLILYSNGHINVDESSQLGVEPRRFCNLKNIKEMKYYPPSFIYPRIYNALNLLASVAGVGLIFTIPAMMKLALYGDAAESIEFLLYSIVVIIWIVFDLIRGNLAAAERLVFDQQNDKVKLTINGHMPNYQLFQLNHLGIILGSMVAFFYFGTFIIQESEVVGDVIVYLSFVVAIVAAGKWIKGQLFVDTEIGLNSQNLVSNNLQHMYLAAMSLRMISSQSTRQIELLEVELENAKHRINQYESILKNLPPSFDIANAPSPSMLVIAIGSCTESLMKNACILKNIGLDPTRPNTLINYIEKYHSVFRLDSQTMNLLTHIRTFRNEAAHYHNLGPTDAITAVSKFVEFLEWYASTVFILEEE